MSVNLYELTKSFNTYFEVEKLEKDPSMSIFLPQVYKNYSPRIDSQFEKDFQKRFNGLMIAGDLSVHTVFTSSFPNSEILKQFLQKSVKGDVLFVHHPIPLECGDPRGHLGRGFIPIDATLLQQIIRKRLSIYSCHAPLDYHSELSTNRAIAQALSAKIESEFLPYGNGNAGLIASISEISTEGLIDKLKNIFSIPYVDFAGIAINKISKIGIVAGGGDDVEYPKECTKYGCQAYISGEITSRQVSQWARANLKKVSKYADTVQMSLIGVSHAASEYLVMKTQLKDWISTHHHVSVIPLAQNSWWI